MIELQGINVCFNAGTPLESALFKGFNLTIKPGEFITIIGGNGAGKSTLLNVIAGEMPMMEGTVLLDKVNVTGKPAFKRARWLSRVFQDPLVGSYADLTIEENLSLALSRGKKRLLKPALNATVREQFRDKLSMIGIGLEKRLADKMGLLSGGQRQAVSLVMATLRPSKILLLDEHTAALDPKMEELILELTERLIKENQLTALMITHCMAQALKYGTRTLVMHHGKIARDLSLSERTALKAADLIQFF